MSAASAATASAGRVPGELCAHAELRDARDLSWATCRDCGALVDVGSLETYGQAEMDAETERAQAEGYEFGKEAEEENTRHVESELRDAEEQLDETQRDLADLRADVSRAITLLGDRAPDVAAMLGTALDGAS